MNLFVENATRDWPWCEPVVTYDNAVLPQALIASGKHLGDAAMTARGLQVLEWLLAVQSDQQGRLMLVGNQGWFARGSEAAKFDQQPVDAMALVHACSEALRVTGD